MLGLWSAASASARPASLENARGTRLAWFSSLEGEKFAELRVSALVPARTRVGPFFISSPGLRPRNLRLEILPVACTPEDWAELLAHLEHLPSDARTPFLLVTPDGQTHRLVRSPRVAHATLLATSAPPPRRQTVHLRVARDPAGVPAAVK